VLFGNVGMGFGEPLGVLMLAVLAVVGVSLLDEVGEGEYSRMGCKAELTALFFELLSIGSRLR